MVTVINPSEEGLVTKLVYNVDQTILIKHFVCVHLQTELLLMNTSVVLLLHNVPSNSDLIKGYFHDSPDTANLFNECILFSEDVNVSYNAGST